MLFHVTMTHSAEDCPAYHLEKMPEFLASLEKLDEVGRELKVKAVNLLWGAPEHVAYAVLEADSPGSIGRYLNSIALVQDYRVTAVSNVSELIEFGKALQAQKMK